MLVKLLNQKWPSGIGHDYTKKSWRLDVRSHCFDSCDFKKTAMVHPLFSQIFYVVSF